MNKITSLFTILLAIGAFLTLPAVARNKSPQPQKAVEISDYRLQKNKHSLDLLNLVEQSLQEAESSKDPFQKYGILYEASDIITAINSVWFLESTDRQRYITLYSQVISAFTEAANQVEGASKPFNNNEPRQESSPDQKISSEIEAYLGKIENRVKNWRQYYELLNQNRPDNQITRLLEEGGHLLQKIQENPLILEDEHILKLTIRIEIAVQSLLKIRDIRYALWAENTLRETENSGTSAAERYYRIAEINISLISELATQKAVASALSTSYEHIPDLEKPAIRHSAIIKLMERKKLEDF